MKWLLTISGILILVAGLAVGFLGHLGVLAAAFFAFIALLITANLDRISEFKASRSGVEAKTREVIARAENTLSELQLLARTVAEVTLSLVRRTGRWDGYTDEEQESIKESVLRVLRKIGVAEADIPKLLAAWHTTTEFDYAHFVLGGSTIPDSAANEVIAEWKELRDGGFERIATPDQIRAFLTRHGFMNDQLRERLFDYEHYRIHREHRRPLVWKDRGKWGRLSKP